MHEHFAISIQKLSYIPQDFPKNKDLQQLWTTNLTKDFVCHMFTLSSKIFSGDIILPNFDHWINCKCQWERWILSCFWYIFSLFCLIFVRQLFLHNFICSVKIFLCKILKLVWCTVLFTRYHEIFCTLNWVEKTGKKFAYLIFRGGIKWNFWPINLPLQSIACNLNSQEKSLKRYYTKKV